MSPLIQTLLATLSATLLGALSLWLVSVVRRDASIVDPCWGVGFAVVASLALALNSPGTVRVSIVVGLTIAWGLRLSLFLLWRNWGLAEDRRYAAMRARHGSRFWRVSLFTVFLLQAAILWFVSMPIQVAAVAGEQTPLGWIDAVGVLAWSIGLFFETVGDWQLARFKSLPANAGRVMDRGLWRFTRHPNYFGDLCVWWGLYLICSAGGAWWTVVSPLLMSLLLMKVSGVALLESTIVERRPAYAAYQARTNALIPGPPR